MQIRSHTERDPGADLIRITAFLMVLTLHFFLRNGFYYQEASDLSGILAVTMRTLTFSCVPLFMMLTGYLKCRKEWGPGYYRSLIPILTSYTLISLIHLPYKLLVLKTNMPAWEWLLHFLSFRLAEYGWYVGMYAGLFLISPLLNLCWGACRTKRQHRAVVLTMIALTALPSTVNAFRTDYPLLPAYFTQIYYVAYYFLGSYVRTYRPKVRKGLCLLCALLLCLFAALINVMTRTDPANFYSGTSAGYGELSTLFVTVLLFLSMYGVSFEKLHLRQWAARLSGLVFEAYLLSYLFDSNIYGLHYKEYPMSLYLPVGILMIGAVALLSFLSAVPVRFISLRVSNWVWRIFSWNLGYRFEQLHKRHKEAGLR